ncbi:MAG: lysylphosphatidylglycerol synthase domain-containing protein [Actinomycetes bacterium]
MTTRKAVGMRGTLGGAAGVRHEALRVACGLVGRLTGRAWVRAGVGLAVLLVAGWYLARVVDAAVLGRVVRAVLADPLGLAVALTAYAAAFGLRGRAWTAVLDGLGFGQSWAALHVALLGNHVLPLRLGEALRVTSVLRRTALSVRPVLASALTLRLADVAGVLVLAAVAAPGLLLATAGSWLYAVSAGILVALAGSLWWLRRLAGQGAGARIPGTLVAATALGAWTLESGVVWQVARAAGLDVSFAAAVAVTAVTIAAQTVAVTPGGFGSYEAAATATLVGLGLPAGEAFAVALTTHAVKTAYALAVGAVALAVPAPAYWGRLRLPRRLPPRPAPLHVDADAAVVAILPAHNEQERVGEVVRGLPAAVHGRRLVTLVVDDGSTDGTAGVAVAAGATVVRQPTNLGLGAAVRRGLAEASARRPACVVYLDADGEYHGTDAERVAGPVLRGEADYVVGSRFAGQIERMLPHRRAGNRVLTAWVRWMTRRLDVTDGQSGYRAFSPAAAADAEVVHDYNYAQVLTLDLLGKGYVYAEVPIRYAFRTSGTSFVRLGRYLRAVVPAVHRELNTPASAPGAGVTFADAPTGQT